MIGFTESAKCATIRKIFDDAYRSNLSCVIVDNIERLIDYGPIGPRYSNLTLQALLVLLKKMPPKGRKLMIVATSSTRRVLEELDMLSAFNVTLHVPNLSRPEHVMAVAERSEVLSSEGLTDLKKQIEGKIMNIGVKKMLGLLDMVKQTREEERVNVLVGLLRDDVISY